MERAAVVKAVIFDVDGTLVDSVDLHARAWQDAFREFGRDVEFARVRQQIGKGGDQLLPVFLDGEERDRFGAELEERRSAILKSRYLHRITAFPGVRALFERLLADGRKIALASSAKQNELDFYKRVARIEDLVDEQTSSDDAERSKPYPDIFEAAVARLGGLPREEVLAVGDTPYDAQAAGKAGLRTVGVLSGGFCEASLREGGCFVVYESPADLLARYDSSPLAR
jgi:HAD superfamily hydrolase (TIGR01549 family)